MSKAKFDDSTNKPLYGERLIEESKIICFENPNKKRIYEISIELPEFTCKCPFSGLSRFCKIKYLLSTKFESIRVEIFKTLY